MFAEMISSLPHRNREFWEWMQSHQQPSWERYGSRLPSNQGCQEVSSQRLQQPWRPETTKFGTNIVWTYNIIVGNLANRQHYRHIWIRHNFILISWRSSEQIADWVKTFLVVWPRSQHSETSVGMEQKTEVQHTCACANGGRGCRVD